MKLKLILVFHAVVTFAAGILLIVKPSMIPGTVNINVSGNQFLLCYLLGSAEFGIAYLSWASRGITNEAALKVISTTFVIFHLATALLELYAFYQGIPAVILINILVRLIIAGLFYYFGVRVTNERR